LDGVLAWRLLDPQMDGIVPDDVRQKCRGDLEWLNANGRDPWLRNAAVIVEKMNALGVPWAMIGGPGQYAPLNMPADCWPRTWDDFDIHVDVSEAASISAVVAALGEEALPLDPTGPDAVPSRWVVKMPPGMEVDLFTKLVYWDGDDDPWLPWKNAVTQTIHGLTFPMQEPLQYAMGLARNTWSSAWSQSARLPLWGLARLAAWTGQAGWSWERLLSFLAADVQRWRADLAANAPKPGTEAVSEWQCCAYCIAWVLDAADRVYRIYPPEIREAGLLPPELRPRYPMTMECFDVVGIDWEDPAGRQVRICEVGEYPGDEAMLFDYQAAESFATRQERGLWKALGPAKTDTSVGKWRKTN
jgi:hypothetical protein